MNLDALNLEALRPLIPLPNIAKAGIVLGAMVVISIIYQSFFWSPLQEKIIYAGQDVEQQRALLVKNQKLASNIPKKKAEYKKLQTQLKVALNMLPKKSQIPDLLEGVTWAGKDSGLAFSSFKPKQEKLQSIYAEVPVALTVVGTFKQLIVFLKRVGEMPRIVDIKKLKLTTGKNQVLKIDGQAVTYRFVELDQRKKPRRPR